MTDRVAKALASMAVIFEKRLTPEAVDLMIGDLSGFKQEDVLAALSLCRREIPRFPTVAEVVKRIPGQNENTQELVGKILEAVELFGYPSPDKAKLHIGEVGWMAVCYFGGWKSICDFPGNEPGILRAQLRMATESAIDKSRYEPQRYLQQNTKEIAP